MSTMSMAEEVARASKHSIAVFAGPVTETNYVESIYSPWKNDLKSIGVIGAAYSYRFGNVNEVFGLSSSSEWGEHFLVEGETGAAYRFGKEDLGEGWVGLYLRYDDFFWNDTVYTTLAVNTGVSLLTDKSGFEASRDSNGKNWELLHYMGPEITFADPDNKNLEFLLRYHHRSGVFGLFDGVVSGSTFITGGIRYRF
jgi:hypothetical protein